jgi:DNA-binding NarL/FixJ family response regulator
MSALALCWTWTRRGDVDRALDELEHWRHWVERRGYVGHEALIGHQYTRLGRADEIAERLSVLAERRPEARFIAQVAEQATAVVDDDGPKLVELALEHAAGASWVYAAEAAAQASQAHERRAERTRALAATLLAETCVSRCDMPPTPAMTSEAILPPGEREAVELAATGWPNAEIAERLCVSPRTVENRLYRAYRRLGVAGRDELTSILSLREELTA